MTTKTIRMDKNSEGEYKSGTSVQLKFLIIMIL